MKNIKTELSLDLECRLSPDLLLYDDKMSQVNLLEDQLGIQSTEVKFENIGRENLKTAAEIYIYLNTCPDSLKPWFLDPVGSLVSTLWVVGRWLVVVTLFLNLLESAVLEC